MNVQMKVKGKHTIVSLDGSLDIYNVGKLKKQLFSIIPSNPSDSIVLDLSKLAYTDSSGIALMAHLRRQILLREGNFCILKAGEDILNVMKLASLDKIFIFIDSVEEL